MRSTFMGLETNKRGLFTQQTALYTTGHNISNANTLGYSRQRVNMQATPGFPRPGLNQPNYPGHLGTGVEAGSIQRIRDEFIDRQYRQETNRLGYWESTVKSISQMEDVMDEPSKYGINQAFTDFWKSMEDITKDPQLSAARQVLIANGRTLADSFNYMDQQLKKIQGNIGNEIKVTTDNVNSLLKQIAQINKQIEMVEPSGYVPNDLYDVRDVLVDELNKQLPVSILREKTGGLAKDVAEGTMTITYVPTDGSAPITLVKGKEYAALAVMDRNGLRVDGEEDDPATGSFAEFQEFRVSAIGDPPADPTTGSFTINYAQLHKEGGGLRALIEAYGHDTGQGLYPEMLANLDTLANEFITTFNTIHRAGFGLNDTLGNRDFFSGTTARDFRVVITDPEDVAVSDTAGESGNNKNMLELAALQSKANAILGQATFQNYYRGITGNLAVRGKEADTNVKNSQALHLQIANNRASMSSVHLDEEMTNMITFQQAYNANARMITVVDETLDRIINGMGRVGL
ncbi:flagellar hook-associated protein FlgK [Lysinibacillus sp. FSL H8-0500]|uniref:Flagellar hook-associated protein 1 n=1 Tax=Lysinibacillus macroides TaxID=33935 RepID=A0A0M9DIX4_9BACI|nr:flagellar hook-associated protein FlgK [Lysinibacillus macroides]KOY82358.1 flagellar hook protein FlgK [Lysinibacillus macroides]QPR66602.1 flagellar hook-associated protein FlgK [Lysinibacillus macroides]